MLFNILFARERRLLSASNVGVAWERAWYRLTGYVALGLIPAFGLPALIVAWVSKAAFPTVPLQALGGAFVFVYAGYLRRRYAVYRAAPPILRPTESPEESSFLLKCRVAVGASLVLTAVLAAVYGVRTS